MELNVDVVTTGSVKQLSDVNMFLFRIALMHNLHLNRIM